MKEEPPDDGCLGPGETSEGPVDLMRDQLGSLGWSLNQWAVHPALGLYQHYCLAEVAELERLPTIRAAAHMCQPMDVEADDGAVRYYNPVFVGYHVTKCFAELLKPRTIRGHQLPEGN